jgi:uncharacterized protein
LNSHRAAEQQRSSSPFDKPSQLDEKSMKQNNTSQMRRVSLAALLAIHFGSPTAAANDYKIKPVPLTEVRFTGGLWHDRQKINNSVTLPFAIQQCESSHRVKNFDLAAETMKRRAAGEKDFQNKPVSQYPFDDSDVFKVIEGAAFCLSVEPNPEIQRKLEEIIAKIAAAQEPDGYLYTWRTMHPDSPLSDWIDQERWLKDPEISHETYNIGHLYEAGVAYEEATGSKSLIDICMKSAELLHRDFGDHEPRLAPGHQVIEMALAKIYRRSGDKRWLDLAKFFIDSRGNGHEYSQGNKPVVEQREAYGHAVRANYLYSGMTDVTALTGDKSYLESINSIWNDVVATKLHLTGGVGARAAGEAYGASYELPHRCYNETCAAIALMFWNHRMFLMTGDSKYMDVFERTLYNGFLSGVSISGDRFFYPNPLEYDGKEVNNHGHAGRAPWFGCACCPPNVLRTMASLTGYAYAIQDENVYINIYAQGEANANVKGQAVKIAQETAYPWQGSVKFTITPTQEQEFGVRLRIPGWTLGKPVPTDLYTYDDPTPANYELKVNGEAVAPAVENGYASVNRSWKPGDVLEMNLPMPVRRVSGNPKVSATRNQVALERGPIVYCLEGIDNENSVFDIALPDTAQIAAVAKPEKLGGITVLDITGAQRVTQETEAKTATESIRATAIPYAAWNNRGLSQMLVWLGRDANYVRPVPLPTIASKAKVTASFSRGGDSQPEYANDLQVPLNATDGFAPNFNFWPHKGTNEWIAYEFEKPSKVSGVTIWWFDDTGSGECRLPKSWKLLYQDASGEWKPIPGNPEYPIRKGGSVEVKFEALTTKALKVELELAEGFSAGLYEWQVSSGQ